MSVNEKFYIVEVRGLGQELSFEVTEKSYIKTLRNARIDSIEEGFEKLEKHSITGFSHDASYKLKNCTLWFYAHGPLEECPFDDTYLVKPQYKSEKVD